PLVTLCTFRRRLHPGRPGASDHTGRRSLDSGGHYLQAGGQGVGPSRRGLRVPVGRRGGPGGEADGRGRRTYRQIVQVLTREAAEAWGEQSYSYVSSRERFTLNWARVVRPDGSVISPA